MSLEVGQKTACDHVIFVSSAMHAYVCLFLKHLSKTRWPNLHSIINVVIYINETVLLVNILQVENRKESALEVMFVICKRSKILEELSEVYDPVHMNFTSHIIKPAV